MTEFRDPNIADHVRPFLRAGLWIASAVLAVGLVVSRVSPSPEMRLIYAGLAVLVALPVTNVIVVLIDEVRLRQWRFVVAAVIVLLILALNVRYKM